MTPPAVTIGMPVYNGATFIRRALDSVLAQDFRDLEVLISDNASTDDTATIIAAYVARDQRIRYVRHESNVGSLNNFIYVLKNARGRWFSWLAHDDYYETADHVRKLSAQLTAGNQLAFPNVNIIHYDADGKIVAQQRDHFAHFRGMSTRLGMSRATVRGASQPYYGLWEPAKLREHFHLLEEDQSMLCFNEGRLIHQMVARERCAFVDDVYLNVGIHGNNLSTSVDPRRLVRDFLQYTWRLLPIVHRGRLRPFERAVVYADIARVHGAFALRLAAAAVKRSIIGKGPKDDGGFPLR